MWSYCFVILLAFLTAAEQKGRKEDRGSDWNLPIAFSDVFSREVFAASHSYCYYFKIFLQIFYTED